MSYLSTKTFGHELGLSVAFRQWRAESHCRFLHGYALSIKLIFTAGELDKFNWVVDFGSFSEVKQALVDFFDHKLLVAGDDPRLRELLELEKIGVAEVVIVKSTGCEAFAKMISDVVVSWMRQKKYTPRCQLVEVEVREHGANSAIYENEDRYDF